MDIEGTQDALSRCATTTLTLIESCLDRIADRDDSGDAGVHAIIELNPRVLEDAASMDRERSAGRVRGPLHGVPVLVKETIKVRGMRTTAGLAQPRSDKVATDDASVVALLRRAGAVILGHTDAGTTRCANPFDLTRSPGGSSAGNGAALAVDFAPAAIGTCTMGSTRIPAAWTSTVGFRPTPGLISVHGIATEDSVFDTVGPMATTVRDVATLLDATVSRADDHSDQTCPPGRTSFGSVLAPDGLTGRRIGAFEPYMHASDSSVEKVIRDEIEVLRGLGATVMSLHDEVTFEVADTPPGCELLWEVAGGRGLNPQGRGSYSNAAGSSEPRARLERATALRQLREWFGDVMSRHDLAAVVYPTVRRTAQPREWGYMWHNTSLASLVGSPAISVPAGFVDHLPIGIDLMGRPGRDAELLGLAFAYEHATHHRRSPTGTQAL